MRCHSTESTRDIRIMKPASFEALLLLLFLPFMNFPLHAQDKNGAVISESISAVLHQIENAGITRETAGAMDLRDFSSPLVRIDEAGRFHIYIYYSSLDEKEMTALSDLGFEVEIQNDGLKVMQGWASFDRVEEIARLPFVIRVTPPGYGTPMTGSVMTEGDAILKADLLRALGLDGRGVKIGVISDGANDLAAAQATGDLPGNIAAFGVCATREYNGESCLSAATCNEGTAMLEIIHDIAPGAELAVAAVNTSLEFAARLDELVNDFGADVIVDDLGFLGEPYFADGPIAQAVAAVTDQVVYVSAAGNHARHHFEADYIPTFFQGVNVHRFSGAGGSPADGTMNITVKPDSFLLVVLQWNDEYGKSANDYDLILITEDETDVLCSTCVSAMTQDGTQDPIEAVCYNNSTDNTMTAKLAIPKYQGSDRRLKLYTSIRGVTLEEYGTAEGSITGHSGLPGAVTVGAIDASDPGHDDVQEYSSWGPARIDFPSYRLIQKPDVTAVDGVLVTGVGGFKSTFYGTSAAAPHVAGVAGLLLQAAPELTPEQIREDLARFAVDIGVSGMDSQSGWGRVDSLASARVTDDDNDHVYDNGDNCRGLANPDQQNHDTDNLGDACDLDDDGDEIPDLYELANGLEPFDPGDALLDTDGDGLDNLAEFQLGTAADRADTDSDGMGDRAERDQGRNPLLNEAAVILLIEGMAE